MSTILVATVSVVLMAFLLQHYGQEPTKPDGVNKTPVDKVDNKVITRDVPDMQDKRVVEVEEVDIALDLVEEDGHPIDVTAPRLVDPPADPEIIAFGERVKRILDEYVDETEREEMERSDEGLTRVMEDCAVFLMDHGALVEFMAFPFMPENLRVSPTLSAMEPAERRKRVNEIFRELTDLLDHYYPRWQKMSAAFRDNVWALHGDFDEAVGFEPAAFMAQSVMERQIAVQQAGQGIDDFFVAMEHGATNFFFWTKFEHTFGTSPRPKQ